MVDEETAQVVRAGVCPCCGKRLKTGLVKKHKTFECRDQRTCGYVVLQSEIP